MCRSLFCELFELSHRFYEVVMHDRVRSPAGKFAVAMGSNEVLHLYHPGMPWLHDPAAFNTGKPCAAFSGRIIRMLCALELYFQGRMYVEGEAAILILKRPGYSIADVVIPVIRLR